jgi:uncharacterized damage-inducible protein DinB
MTTHSFAAWVEPLAASYRGNRAEVVQLARTLTEEQLSRPTGDEGWSVRKEVTHIAASDPDFVRTLNAILDGGTPDLSLFTDIDARNARNLEAWKDRSVEEIAGELESNGLALQDLLARLADDDEGRQPEGLPFPIGFLINGYGQHGPYHLGQIRQAIGHRG